MKLSQIHPIFYHTRIWQKRLTRRLLDMIQRKHLAVNRQTASLPISCKRHQSLLRRKLGQSDPILQENKIVNLGIAIRQIDGIIIRPGETFSFWKLVGKTTAKKGYIEGLLLSQGEVITGVGGGICQLANLLFWMALHSPLQVVERHHHHFDPFPDDQRVLPFGSGASVFYNFIDLRFYNPTDRTFQFRIWLTDKHLKGSLLTDQEWPFSYHVEERNHQYLQVEGKNFRKNEIWRLMIDKRTGDKIKEECMINNFSEVKYAIPALEKLQ